MFVQCVSTFNPHEKKKQRFLDQCSEIMSNGFLERSTGESRVLGFLGQLNKDIFVFHENSQV